VSHALSVTGLQPRFITAELTTADADLKMAHLNRLPLESLNKAVAPSTALDGRRRCCLVWRVVLICLTPAWHNRPYKTGKETLIRVTRLGDFQQTLMLRPAGCQSSVMTATGITWLIVRGARVLSASGASTTCSIRRHSSSVGYARGSPPTGRRRKNARWAIISVSSVGLTRLGRGRGRRRDEMRRVHGH